MRIALKVDVDTLRGSIEGAPHLAQILRRHGARATFLFSLGPDHTGRSIFRMFRPEMLAKVSRTSVVQHYGIRTLLYGTLLPGPDIGLRATAQLRQIASEFEVGVHAWDHVAWHNRVARASNLWTQRHMERAVARFTEIFGSAPQVHGAAGWQMNPAAFALEKDLGFRYASDTRGTGPFVPLLGDVRASADDASGTHAPDVAIPQLPTTLPTFDELLGRDGWNESNLHDTVLSASAGTADHVFTLHAELEGGKLAGAFERLLRGWKAHGADLVSLGDLAAGLDPRSLPRARVIHGRVPGRAGTLALQAPSP